MVDCGRAATQRALDAGLDPTAVTAVLITHHHSDHLSDMATFAIARWVAGATSPLQVIAPEGPAAEFARRCLDAFDDQAFHSQGAPSAGKRPAISCAAFAGSHDVATVFRTDEWAASSVLVDHHPVEPAVGYLVESNGARVAISGDTAVCAGIRRLARGAHVIVHEALLGARASPALLEWNASAHSVGELAAETRPETLVLTHMIPAPSSAGDELAYLDEVRRGGFTGRTLVAKDLMRLSVGP
jgi:ribonuclease Z